VLYPLLEATRGGALALGARALDRLKMFAGVMYLASVVSRRIAPDRVDAEALKRSLPQPFLIRLTSACVKAAVLALPPRSPVRTWSILNVASIATRSRVASSVNLQ